MDEAAPSPTTDPAHEAPRQRCLVTGGAGFIGSHLTDALLALGHEVVVVDDLSTGRLSNLENAVATGRCHVIQSKLSEALSGELGSQLASFDAVYHLAATVGVGLVMRQQARSIENNIGQTADLFDALLEAKSEAAVLLASSSEVYGKPTTGVFSEDDDVVYGPTTVGRWSYAASKAIDEYLALAHHREHQLPVIVARLFNTVGPRQVGAYGMVLPRFVQAALAGEPLEVHGDGEQSRCFCDARDVVQGLIALTREPKCLGRVFNVGAETPLSINDLARLVLQTLPSSTSPGIRRIPYSEVYPEGFEDIRRRRPDVRRVKEATGWSPKIPMTKTIADLAATVGSASESGARAPAMADEDPER